MVKAKIIGTVMIMMRVMLPLKEYSSKLTFPLTVMLRNSANIVKGSVCTINIFFNFQAT